jgi:hypothetical protein
MPLSAFGLGYNVRGSGTDPSPPIAGAVPEVME